MGPTVKKILSMLLAVILLLSLLPAAAESAETGETHTLETGSFPLRFGMGIQKELGGIELVFLDGVRDLPYIDLLHMTEVLNRLAELEGKKEAYTSVPDENGGTIQINYAPTDTFVSFNFEEDKVFLSDFDLFSAYGKSNLPIMQGMPTNENGEPKLFREEKQNKGDRPGEFRIIDMAEYTIPMVHQDGKFLFPMHTAFDLLYGLPRGGVGNYFNGKIVCVGDQNVVMEKWGEELQSAGPVKRSAELAAFGVHELCMELDNFYGLKDAHRIRNFDSILLGTDYYNRLSDPDPAVADDALQNFIQAYLDDQHSAFNQVSWMLGKNGEIDMPETGVSMSQSRQVFENYKEAREEYFPEAVPFYQEVGDTAFLTFDSFDYLDQDYYRKNYETTDEVWDTVDMVLYADRQIRRKDSPVKNVVMDLSLNSGGRADAAVFVMCWYLGAATVANEDTFSGRQGTSIYMADINLDGIFDFTDDSLPWDLNLYCLIAPNSFSCGNLVPWVFRTSGRVTLLGDTSGGGSCIVLPMTTVWGSSYQISGFQRLAFVKNGSFYDIDRGVDPNYPLTKYASFYDRQRLAEILHRMD